MSSIQRFEVVGLGPNRIEPNIGIVAEAGWDTTKTIEAAVLLKSTKPLKSAKVVVELRGLTETRWKGPKPLDMNDTGLVPQCISKQFLKVTEVVTEKEWLEPDEPVPPSYNDPAGTIVYYFKTTLSFQQGLKLLKTHREIETPIQIIIPESARERLLSNDSPIYYKVPPTNQQCGYTVNIPSRVLKPGDRVFVTVTVDKTPAT
ncbi:hypothetical protein HDU76_008942 [Blyttiomyces sp. JEL0837]|nr:hypothetical protein HDU76_008942 [Blyttiomyces sp. JEL0837]